MVFSSSVTEVDVPRRMAWCVRMESKISTTFIQDAESRFEAR